MNKSELVLATAQKVDATQKQTDAVLTAALEVIIEALTKGEDIKLVGFGTFEVRQRQEREGRNPATGESIKIPAMRVPAFSPGKVFKERIANESKVKSAAA